MNIDALRELARRHGAAGYTSELFAQQVAFIDDPSRTKAALCSRRAGKTWSACAYLLREAEAHPGTVSVYIALTRASAKRLLWEELGRFNQRRQLGIVFNHSELTAKLPNGSSIFLVGADDAATIERLRGGKYQLVVIDEAASFRPSVLQSLVREILRPALVDLRGTLCLIGTPGAACVGLFYDATTDPESPFSVHHWTVRDNPHIPHIEEEIESEKRANRWDDNHPIYRREWLGEWVRDSSSLVYQYATPRNHADRLPADDGRPWSYVLGIDYGFTDSTAFCVIGWRKHDKELYIVESSKEAGLIPSAAAEKVLKLNERYHFSRIVGDVGGLGKGYAEEARQRWAVPIIPAQKQNKRGYIDLLNGDMISGLLRVLAGNAALVEEMSILQWSEDRSAPDDRYEDHLCDAMLYAWREAKAWAQQPEKVKPAPGTPEWEAAEEARMAKQLGRGLRGDKPWWDRR